MTVDLLSRRSCPDVALGQSLELVFGKIKTPYLVCHSNTLVFLVWPMCGKVIAMVIRSSLLWRFSGLFRAAKSRFALKRSYQNTTVAYSCMRTCMEN